jgi:hypothetical protein
MRAIAKLTLALALTLGLAGAQESGHTIELEMVTINYWHVVEIEWAGDEPLSGETSTFDGRCSVPSDYYAWGSSEGLIFPSGPFTAETEQCGQLIWEEEDGSRMLRGRLATDGSMTLHSDDGSVMTASYYADESSFDPVMGVYLYGMQFEVESMTGLPGLTFVAGEFQITFVIPDIAALLTESVPAIGAGHGFATFVPAAAD